LTQKLTKIENSSFLGFYTVQWGEQFLMLWRQCDPVWCPELLTKQCSIRPELSPAQVWEPQLSHCVLKCYC